VSHDLLATDQPSPKTVIGRARTQSCGSMSRALTLALGIVVVLGHGTARGEVPRPKEVAADGEVKKPSPWRASEIAYRNSVTAISLDRSAELTYNPFWGMALEISPRYWFDDTWSVAASLEVQRELTEADDTTRDNETQLGDLSLRFIARNLAKIPGIDAQITGILGFSFPTSLASQGQTMLFTVAPSMRLGWSFSEVLSGLAFGYTVRFTKLFYEYTTGELESPVVPGCFAGSSGSCDRFLNTGVRNASYRLSNNFDASLFFTEELSMSASFGFVVSWLYDDVDDERVNFQQLEPQDERYALIADVGLTWVPAGPLAVTFGASTFNPQLAPDGSRYTPFFNRFTTLYLDLRVDVAALVSELSD
jgi:hypothetical protein